MDCVHLTNEEGTSMKRAWILSVLLFSNLSWASIENIVIDGTVPSTVTLNSTDSDASAKQTKKDIRLLHVSLSSQARAYLAEQASQQYQHRNQSANHTREQSSVQLGMNGTPVFDQGAHGTCATFSTTAAIDAYIGMGDVISQLCHLELGSYLHQLDASYLSGWDGAYIHTVMDQLKKYGAITMPKQLFFGCSGMHIYPASDASNQGYPMSITDYIDLRDRTNVAIKTHSILQVSDALTPRMNAETTLESVKSALRAGNRVVIGILIDQYRGENGALGRYGLFTNSWILTPEILQDAKNGKIDAAHALVLTGYDDDAVIYGPDDSIHQGVLTLRNSWGLFAGYFGNYYMSYDYFKTFSIELLEINFAHMV